MIVCQNYIFQLFIGHKNPSAKPLSFDSAVEVLGFFLKLIDYPPLYTLYNGNKLAPKRQPRHGNFFSYFKGQAIPPHSEFIKESLLESLKRAFGIWLNEAEVSEELRLEFPPIFTVSVDLNRPDKCNIPFEFHPEELIPQKLKDKTSYPRGTAKLSSFIHFDREYSHFTAYFFSEEEDEWLHYDSNRLISFVTEEEVRAKAETDSTLLFYRMPS